MKKQNRKCSSLGWALFITELTGPFCLLMLFALLTPLINAEPISTWVDKDGVRHFSSSPNKGTPISIPPKGDIANDLPSPQQENNKEAINLPSIEKYDIDSRIKSVQALTPETCLNHGGINCEAGMDIDGSVICYDSTRSSLEQFESSCKEARLTGSIKTPPAGMNKRQWSVPISVQVRNETGIEARQIRVKASYPENINSEDRVELYLEGPTTLAPYGTAEYTYSGKLIDNRLANRANIKIYCENCWSPEKNLVSPSASPTSSHLPHR